MQKEFSARNRKTGLRDTPTQSASYHQPCLPQLTNDKRLSSPTVHKTLHTVNEDRISFVLENVIVMRLYKRPLTV